MNSITGLLDRMAAELREQMDCSLADNENVLKLLAEYERARASDPPGADAGVGEAVATLSINSDGYHGSASFKLTRWDLPLGDYKLYTSPPHPSATNNVSHPAVREVTIEDVQKMLLHLFDVGDVSVGEGMLAALKSIHAVIAEVGVAK